MRRIILKSAAVVAWLLLAGTALAQQRLPWDLKALSAPPKTYPAPADLQEAGVCGLFYDGLPWQGKPTRVFAWYGVPKDLPANGRFPAMVLIHGGGGTAHARWVRLWNQRGYAAISMDLCGKLPIPKQEKYGGRHDMAGPEGWDSSFQQIDSPIEDQWPYHAVADAILAHSLIRSFPEVDPERIGVTGISWGGYLTCIVAGVDGRFKFASPVYGCGFLGEGSAWVPRFEKMGKEKTDKWLGYWDPSVYLPNAKMPMLWVDGNVDFAYPLACVQKSYRLPQGQRWLATKPGMKHSHPDGEVPAEIGVFADQILKAAPPLWRCTSQGMEDHQIWAVFTGKTPALVKAQAVYTKDSGPWQKRTWMVEDAVLDKAAERASFQIPPGVRAIYLTVTDERGLLASSEHVEISDRP